MATHLLAHLVQAAHKKVETREINTHSRSDDSAQWVLILALKQTQGAVVATNKPNSKVKEDEVVCFRLGIRERLYSAATSRAKRNVSSGQPLDLANSSSF